MSTVEKVPFASRKHINVLEEGYAGSEMLQLPPAVYPTPDSVFPDKPDEEWL